MRGNSESVVRRAGLAVLILFAVSTGARGTTSEEYFVKAVAMADAVANGCPLLEINPEAQLFYMASVGLRPEDFAKGGRLFDAYLMALLDATERVSKGVAPLICRFGEERFGEKGTLWPRLLRPKQSP